MKKVLRKIKAGWMAFAHRFARVQTVIIVTLFYFTVIAPLGLILTLFGWDPLERRGFRRSVGDDRSLSNWKTVNRDHEDNDSLERMS